MSSAEHAVRIGKRSSHRSSVGKPEGRDRLEGLGVDGLHLKCVLKTRCDDVNWINLAHGRTSGGLLTDTPMNFRAL
jgi:hypothetical protein